ncbi:MAG: hypothetical protein ACT4NU_07655 [Chromatiales bacterium]
MFRVVVPVLLAAAAAIWAIEAQRRPSDVIPVDDRLDGADPARTESPASRGEETARGGDGGIHEEGDLADEVTAQKQELARLSADFAALREDVRALRQTAAQSNVAEREREPDDEYENLDPEWAAEQELEREQTIVEARMQDLDAQLESEQPDVAWASHAGTTLWQALAGQDLAGTTVAGLDCRATLCRLDLNHEDEASRDRFLQITLDRRIRPAITDMLDAMTLHPVQNSDGSIATVIFWARAGHRLPPLETDA